MEELDPDDFIETDHPRVFYRNKSDAFDRGELQMARFIAKHLPNWRVLITMGPNRSHDVRFQLHDNRWIHLDVYSPGMVVYGPDVSHRQEHPAVMYAESLIHDIAESIKNSDQGFDLRDELE